MVLDIWRKIYWWVWSRYYDFVYFISAGDYMKKHIVIQRDGMAIKIRIKNHPEFVSEVKKKIDKLSKKDTQRYVEKVFGLVNGCNQLIFKKYKHELRFMLNHNRFVFYRIQPRTNIYKSNYLAMIGLLADMNFIKNDLYVSALQDNRPKHYIYKIKENSSYHLIEANFKKDAKQVAVFVSRMFRDVFREGGVILKTEIY